MPFAHLLAVLKDGGSPGQASQPWGALPLCPPRRDFSRRGQRKGRARHAGHASPRPAGPRLGSRRPCKPQACAAEARVPRFGPRGGVAGAGRRGGTRRGPGLGSPGGAARRGAGGGGAGSGSPAGSSARGLLPWRERGCRELSRRLERKGVE